MDELLRIENLAVEYQSERAVAKALNGINLTIGKGESLGLVGETGAGKTTIALSTLRLLPKRASRIVDGDIIYKNKSVFEMSKKELMWGDRIFEKCGIGRDEGGDGGKTLEIRGKRRLSARDGGANYQQS